MRITLFAAGSRGDVQPCAALGQGLQRAGYDVCVAAPENFATFIQSFGLEFHPLRGDVQRIMSGETGRNFMEGGGANPFKAMRSFRAMLGPVATQMAEDALAATRGADALIALAVFAPFGQSIAEICGVPLINVEPTPLLPTGDFPAPGWPFQRSLGPLYNRLSGHAMLRMIWQWYGPFVNDFRRCFGLPAYRGGDFYHTLTSTPLLGAYSPAVISPPRDWPASAHITGYWFAETQPAWQPSPALEAFLNGGAPPVYVGFGSMGGRNPEQLAACIIEVLAQSGQRGVLLTGWGALHATSLPDSVFVLDGAPHDRLFPHMAAVVHHGGAGTTAEGLRAGVPTVIVPFIVDQPFWGQRIHAQGVGPPPIPRKQLTSDKLAQAIEAACTDPQLKARAAALGRTIRTENGVDTAVNIIRRHLGG